MDAEDRLWIAQWGAGRVAAYGPDGNFVQAISLPADQVTCPAFGGHDLQSLYVTSAAEGLTAARCAEAPHQGKTFTVAGIARGLKEPQVIM